MSERLPAFITFTGVDDHTPIPGLVELSDQYPVEWGVLFSQKQQGTGRYPSLPYIDELVDAPALRLSAHLCGAWAREVLDHGRSVHDALLADHFRRAQINVKLPFIDTAGLKAWGDKLHLLPILQCRDGFPKNPDVSWLYDPSGGRGETPAMWPVPPDDAPDGELYGFAGGIRPGNVAGIVSLLGKIAGNYWIDMESGVRSGDADNSRFDLELCRRICKSVYGEPGEHLARSQLAAHA